MHRLFEIKLRGIAEEHGIRNRGKYKIMRHVADKERKGMGQEQKSQDKCFEGDDKMNLPTYEDKSDC